MKMSVPKLAGIETEYAIVIENKEHFDHQEACNMLLDKFTSSVSDNKNIRCIPVDRQDGRDVMLSNGARFYIDLKHPEYSTPECVEPTDLVACDKAGELIIHDCVKEINKELPEGQRMRIFKNNSDHKGHTYGCHENYLMSAPAFKRLIKEKKEELFKHLIPFLVTRQIYTGSGKIGSECGINGVKFQLSQRADFFKEIIGKQTTDHRPIINTRDEAHADEAHFRRLHIITGDANMSEYSTYLKVGVTQVVLRMIEEGFIQKDLSLADPVRAIKAISQDPSLTASPTALTAKVRLKNGKEFTALEIQKEFLETADAYLSGKRNSPATSFMRDVLSKWSDVLKALDDNPMSLYAKIDWVIKKSFIDRWKEREKLNEDNFSDPRIEEIDTNYHDIDRERGIFYLLQKHELVERLFPSDEGNAIESFITEPPGNSRAFLRAGYIKDPPGKIKSADWEKLVLEETTIELPDPTRSEK